jgi:hypothetical protein
MTTAYNFASWKKTEPEVIKIYDTSKPPEYKLHLQYPKGWRYLMYKPHTSELTENGIPLDLSTINMEYKAGHFHEVGGDQRVQVNGVTSHRTSKDRDETTGGTKVQSVLADYFSSVGGEYQQNVSTDISISSGGQMGLTAGEQMGLGAGDTIGIASAAQVQMKAATGTFITDDYAINIISNGSAGALMWGKGYKAGIFSSGHDVRVGAGGKFLTQTDGGSKLDSAGLIPPAGKSLPT